MTLSAGQLIIPPVLITIPGGGLNSEYVIASLSGSVVDASNENSTPALMLWSGKFLTKGGLFTGAGVVTVNKKVSRETAVRASVY